MAAAFPSRLLFPALLCVMGCGRSTLPDPHDAVVAYAAAARAGDYQALYAMMSERSRRARTVEDVKQIVADERAELAFQAEQVTDKSTTLRATARLRYADGEDATLDLEHGVFRVSAADALPAGARSPEQALEQLRRALARRSYAGLMRLLSPTTRGAIEGDLRSLVDGLSHPDGLDVQVSGDVASVQIRGGHLVKLRREAGIWHVEDFD